MVGDGWWWRRLYGPNLSIYLFAIKVSKGTCLIVAVGGIWVHVKEEKELADVLQLRAVGFRAICTARCIPGFHCLLPAVSLM